MILDNTAFCAIDLKNPRETAYGLINDLFLLDGQKTLVFYDGFFWEFKENVYVKISKHSMLSKISSFMSSHVGNDGKLLKFKKSDIVEVYEAASQITNFESDVIPCWIEKSENLPDPFHLIGLKNGLFNYQDQSFLMHSPNLFNVNICPFNYDPLAV